MTKDEIVQKALLMKYYTKGLTPVKDAWESINKDDEEQMKDFMAETLMVNKLLTVKRSLQYLQNNLNNSRFKRDLFIKRITNADLPRDRYGVIGKFGVYMPQEIYEEYRKAFIEITNKKETI